MKLIVYNNDDGFMSVVIPAYKDNMSESDKDSLLNYVISNDIPKLPNGQSRKYFIIERSQLPDRKYLKNSWKVNETTGGIYLDKTLSTNHKKQQFRTLRKPLLEKLDVDFMRALENGDTNLVNTIKQKKQELRDITTINMDNYDTAQKLHDFIPDILKS